MTSKTVFDRFVKNVIQGLARSKAKATGIKAEGLLAPRGNQFDTRGIAELQAARFSGIRSNDLYNRFEFWILGNIAETVSYQQMLLNPDIMNRTYCELFGLNEVEFDPRTKEDIERIRNLKEQVKEAERKA